MHKCGGHVTCAEKNQTNEVKTNCITNLACLQYYKISINKIMDVDLAAPNTA